MIAPGSVIEITRADGRAMKFLVLEVSVDDAAITLCIVPEPPPEPELLPVPTLDEQAIITRVQDLVYRRQHPHVPPGGRGTAWDPHARLPPGWHPL